MRALPDLLTPESAWPDVVARIRAAGSATALPLERAAGERALWSAVDTLDVYDLGTGYSGWLGWALEGDVAGYYGPLRWQGWASEAQALAWGQGLHAWPPPWSVEGADPGAASRRPVPLAELWALMWDTRCQVAGR